MESIVEITRLEEGEAGTMGALRVNKRLECLTLEPQDRFNRQGISSIPAQQYRCERVRSPRFGETFAVCGVPGRDHILFHPGNLVEDTQGCILLGTRFGAVRGQRGVLDSGIAFERFMTLLRGQETCHLTIAEHY